MAHLRAAALAAAVLALAGRAASAQTAVPVEPAPATDLDAKPGTLSDKLSQTRGVVKPMGDVDPGMRRGAPKIGSMPILEPGTVAPGTPK